MRISRIGVIAHRRVESELARKIADKLSRNADVFFDPITAEKINREKTEVKDMRIDLAVIVGGDGTILWAVNELSNEPLILGINVGKVGHLAELSPGDIPDKLDLLLRGEFFIDERMKLKIDDEVEALNEALILSRQASLLEFKISIDDIEVARFRADGVMVSTPTGSTGHSMSSGGPILHPRVRAYIITPVNPFLREQSPLVVPADSETGIELIREGRDAQLIVDGRITREIKPHQRVSIKRAKKTTRFVRFHENFDYDHINIKRKR
ncbi:MAG: hypothetical protein DRO89_01610 [Candidatus Altiarchaeales archaeon]|nr:MAG: hypothetical protein DRO89_01610 [Candidatus Altiarchaeales archaeon]